MVTTLRQFLCSRLLFKASNTSPAYKREVNRKQAREVDRRQQLEVDLRRKERLRLLSLTNQLPAVRDAAFTNVTFKRSNPEATQALSFDRTISTALLVKISHSKIASSVEMFQHQIENATKAGIKLVALQRRLTQLPWVMQFLNRSPSKSPML